MAVYKEDGDDRLMDTAVRVCKLVLLACELGDRAPAADAVSDDVIVQLLVFLGRPEPLAELGLHAAAAAGEPSHSPLPRALSLCSDDDGDKLRDGARATSAIDDRCHLQWRSVWLLVASSMYGRGVYMGKRAYQELVARSPAQRHRHTQLSLV
jgi:hypothetical protein